MSALILCAHVKQGAELAAEHKLGREISDIIIQHHGTRTISYFFQKALDMGENPRPEDYSYPGPKPQSLSLIHIWIPNPDVPTAPPAGSVRR